MTEALGVNFLTTLVQTFPEACEWFSLNKTQIQCMIIATTLTRLSDVLTNI